MENKDGGSRTPCPRPHLSNRARQIAFSASPWTQNIMNFKTYEYHTTALWDLGQEKEILTILQDLQEPNFYQFSYLYTWSAELPGSPELFSPWQHASTLWHTWASLLPLLLFTHFASFPLWHKLFFLPVLRIHIRSWSCLSLWCGSGSYLSLWCSLDPDPSFHIMVQNIEKVLK